MTEIKKVSEEYQLEIADRKYNFTIEQDRHGKYEVTVMYHEDGQWTTLISSETVLRFLEISNVFQEVIKKLNLEDKQ